MITNKMKNVIAKSIISELDKDTLIKRQLVHQSKNSLLINTLLCLVVCGIHLYIKYKFGYHAFATSMFIGIFYEIPVIFIILIMISNGNKPEYEPRFKLPLTCILCNIISIIEALVVFTWIPYYFAYDFTTDTSSLAFWKLLIVSPILFIIIVIWSISTHGYNRYNVYSTYYNYNKSLYYTIERSGIHPEKLPYSVYTDRYVRQLTEQDWREIGLIVKSFGYNLFTY